MIYTIGHSTRRFDEFAALLRGHGVRRLADVRTVPGSRRHPQFARDTLARALAAERIAYRHFPGLGGLRKPRRDSPNSGWRNESFRGYADHMQTAQFERALEELIEWAGETHTTEEAEDAEGVVPEDLASRSSVSSVVRNAGASRWPVGEGATAIMCAEAVWWRCHRQLIADALVARGVPVRHITRTSAEAHTLSSFARVDANGRVTYPGLV